MCVHLFFVNIICLSYFCNCEIFFLNIRNLIINSFNLISYGLMVLLILVYQKHLNGFLRRKICKIQSFYSDRV